MPAVGYSFNFLRGLSDFWQRFFADAHQLEALYQGAATLIGQAYLDLMSATLGVSLKDAVALDREYYRLIAIREDELRYDKGATVAEDRWVYELEDPVVDFASLDNRVYEPTASLEPQRDYETVDRAVRFKLDPTDPTGSGLPHAGFARRALDVAVGGMFSDIVVSSWLLTGARKGDTVRLLDVAPDGTQHLRSDHDVVLVRQQGLYVAADTPLPAAATSVTYVVLRYAADAEVLARSFTMTANVGTLAHKRLDVGSVIVHAKAPDGSDVVEGVDYRVNYESGIIYALTEWIGMSLGSGTFSVSYAWREEVWPIIGAAPRKSTTGGITAATTARVLQIATWAPDARVDRRTLANNFGVLIGREADSSEAYRAFLQGIFQLYLLGPVLERVESALNVVLNLPVVRDDDEVLTSIDLTDAYVDRVTTLRATGEPATYTFPKGTPLRSDLEVGMSFLAFEPLTAAVEVTDYVQTPNWWHGAMIPRELFSGEAPVAARRTASAAHVPHVYGAVDEAEFGDPGLYVGANEEGLVLAGPTVYRRRMAFVLMDRYLKHHTFSVSFDATALAAGAGVAFAQSLTDLNELVLASKPSHTFAFTRPSTFFKDEIQMLEEAISFDRQVGSRKYGPDRVVFADGYPTYGSMGWTFGDHFHYTDDTESVAFPTIGVAVALPGAPSAPRRARLVRVVPNATIGGLRVIENVDYSVDYETREVTRLTVWDSTTVNVWFRQVDIGNVLDAARDQAVDVSLLTGGVDPALVTATFDPAAAQWDGTVTPSTAPRDIGMVERALIVLVSPA